MFRDFNKYEVFEDGRIWSYMHNKWLKPNLRHDGYLRVKLSDNDGKIKNYYLHRIIYEAVTGQPIPEDLQVNHINEDKTDNRFENLNLMTPKQNMNHGTRNERISKKVEQYDKDGNLINIWTSSKEIERELGYAKQNISSCCHGRYKQAYGFIWKFAS